MAITLQEITKDNWRQCVKLKVADDQQEFVAPNVYSLAQSKFEPDVTTLAIYDDVMMVGFIMYQDDKAEKTYYIWRLMIDQSQQNKGYGRAAMLEVLNLLKTQPDYTEIGISYVPENTVAEKLYNSLGFEKTGEIIDGEVTAAYKIHKPE